MDDAFTVKNEKDSQLNLCTMFSKQYLRIYHGSIRNFFCDWIVGV